MGGWRLKIYVVAGLNVVLIAIIVIGVLCSTKRLPIAVMPDFDSAVHIAEFDSGSASAELATQVATNEMMMNLQTEIIVDGALQTGSFKISFRV